MELFIHFKMSENHSAFTSSWLNGTDSVVDTVGQVHFLELLHFLLFPLLLISFISMSSQYWTWRRIISKSVLFYSGQHPIMSVAGCYTRLVLHLLSCALIFLHMTYLDFYSSINYCSFLSRSFSFISLLYSTILIVIILILLSKSWFQSTTFLSPEENLSLNAVVWHGTNHRQGQPSN